MKFSKWILFSLIALAGLSVCFWVKISLEPLYSDARFQPTDKLHAGCVHTANITYTPQEAGVDKIVLNLNYNPQDIEIQRIVPNINNAQSSSQIAYNTITLNIDKPVLSQGKQIIFQIYFKSNAELTTTQLALWSGSYIHTKNKTLALAQNFDLAFAKVAECEPDIISPSINLIYPQDPTQRLTLDQYFIFNIKDIGKGIDKTSVMVNFDGDVYYYGADNLKRNGDYLTFYPRWRLPIDKTVSLKILVTDQQIYGGANKAESAFSFQTATWMSLKDGIDPTQFRLMTKDAAKIFASNDECSLLDGLSQSTNLSSQQWLRSILTKLGCNTEITANIASWVNDHGVAINEKNNSGFVSVFALIGWVLFLITFGLKLHYMMWYRKYKKASK